MKKGFTLIELMAVMIILGIISFIAVPAVLNVLKQNNDDAYNIVISNIKLSMQNFKNDHPLLNPAKGETLYMTLGMLKQENYLDDKVINPKTNEFIPNDMLLSIRNENGRYIYTVDMETGTETEDYSGLTPYIELSDYKKTLLVGDTYTETPIAYYGNGTIADVSITSSVIGDEISTSAPGTFYVVYKASVDGISVATVQTVVVKRSGSICTLANATTIGLFTAGDLYYCNPGDGVLRPFYVLSVQSDDVDLIMGYNLGETVAWNKDEGEEALTAYAYLKMLTRTWTDVEVSLPDVNKMVLSLGKVWNDGVTGLPTWLYEDFGVLEAETPALASGYWTNMKAGNYAYMVNQTTGAITASYALNDDEHVGVRPIINVAKEDIDIESIN